MLNIIETENFRDIPEFEGLYKISENGTVYNVKRNRIVKATIVNNPEGKFCHLKPYLQVTLQKDKKGYVRSVHRLVASAFLPRPDGCKSVGFKDKNSLNCNVSNLRWIVNPYRSKKVEE